ncbi:ATP-dependent endonuclease [Ohtaekwangia kribbensis]|uniref:ATP-dependent endonuclease n=1 Tax=Ohtaekwangia kribbensis TaxID=688913 RepID=A0ABW3K7W3_9BACT
MDLIHQGQFNLTGLSKINVLLGKNGSGKSTLLKKVENRLTQQQVGEINYVTPERGGDLRYEAGVEQNVITGGNWTRDQKGRNQWGQFKNYSVAQYRRLETLSLREIETDQAIRANFAHTFNSTIDKINGLLTNIKIVRTPRGDFELFTVPGNQKLEARLISSGESELIALAIECLTFEKSCDPQRQNVLLLDEPDVHLHPDLQVKFISFLIDLVSTDKFSIIIATHSTAILGALLDYSDARFAILANASTDAAFRQIDQKYRAVLPIFGAHPLSNLFSQSPIMLVEGEDEERIFQQAIRSSNGQLKLYPCGVGGVGNLPDFETSVVEILKGVYDNATGYSLRDRDEGDEAIADIPPLVRFKTSCRASENLIVTDEVLETMGTTWANLEAEIEKWLVAPGGHVKHDIMTAFKASGYARKTFDLKEIRNILVGLTGSAKPWEIAVGQTISKIVRGQIPKDFNDNKLCNFLGTKLSNTLRP